MSESAEDTEELRNLIRRELVADVFMIWLPTIIMGAIFAVVAVALRANLSDRWIDGLIVLGLLTSAMRIVVILAGGRAYASPAATDRQLRAYAGLLVACYLSFATVIGLLSYRVVMLGMEPMVLLVLVMTVGYCAGVTSCAASMWRMSAASLCLAVLPTTLACLLSGSTLQQLTALLILGFFIGGLLFIRDRYRSRIAEIVLRARYNTLAHCDHLTGLANRLQLATYFERLKVRDEGGPMIAVCCLDLDGFKPINDRFGHTVGDEALRRFAARLRELTPVAGIVARTGGDEFVVVRTDIADKLGLAAWAKELDEGLALTLTVEGQAIPLRSSVGCSIAPRQEADLDLLIIEADGALLVQKDERRAATARSGRDHVNDRHERGWIAPAPQTPNAV